MIKSLRKRWVLFAIFLTSLIYFVYNMLQPSPENVTKDQNLLQASDYRARLENVLHNLKWHISDETTENNDTQKYLEKPGQCRNSLQGRYLITDEKGYVCKRSEVLTSGCCNQLSNTTTRYHCSSCAATDCCSVYEHCVSCCMEPNKRSLLENVLRVSSDSFHKNMLLSIRDQFELCLSKCRTSSSSVQHENMYRNTKLKYCFGNKIPDLKIT